MSPLLLVAALVLVLPCVETRTPVSSPPPPLVHPRHHHRANLSETGVLLCDGIRYHPLSTHIRRGPTGSESGGVVVVESGFPVPVTLPVLPPSLITLEPGTIGSGAHGEIFPGLLVERVESREHKKSSPLLRGRKRVALKFLDRDSRPRHSCSLLREAAAHAYVHARMRDVVPFLGIVDATAVGLKVPVGAMSDAERRGTVPLLPRFAVVMARMRCAAPTCPEFAAPPPSSSSSPTTTTTLRLRLQVLLQVADSLRALHEVVGAAHGDVKGLNILVDDDDDAEHEEGGPGAAVRRRPIRARLADFGRFALRSFGNGSTSCGYALGGAPSSSSSPSGGRDGLSSHRLPPPLYPSSSSSSHTLPRPPSRWPVELISRVSAGDGMVYTDGFGAPETLYCPALNAPTGATAASDVFAFAVTMWEMLTRSRPAGGPFAFLPTQRLLDAAIIAGARPPLDDLVPSVPADVVRLMTSCWHGERGSRPRMSEVVGRLRRAVAEVERGGV